MLVVSNPSQFEIVFKEVDVKSAGDGSIEDRFEAFDFANPHVYRMLRDMALELKRVGVKKWGIAGLFEVLRRDYALKTRGGKFKLNNDFRSHYARALMARERELDGFFETRKLRSQA